MPNPKLRKAISSAKRKTGRTIVGRTNISQATNMFRAVEARNLEKISNNPRSKNRELASTLLRIFQKAERGEMVANELFRSSDRNALARIMVKINAFDRQSRPVRLTQIEQRILDSYAKQL